MTRTGNPLTVSSLRLKNEQIERIQQRKGLNSFVINQWIVKNSNLWQYYALPF